MRVWKKKKSDEVHEDRPSFYMMVLQDPGNSHQILQIPRDFVEYLDKRTFQNATLRGPSGRGWPVKLVENKKGVFIKDGWDQFLDDNSIGLGNCPDILIFIYDGELSFDVRTFEPDGLEKVVSNKYDASAGPSDDPLPREVSQPVDGKRKRGRPRKNSLHNLQPNRKGKDVPRDGPTAHLNPNSTKSSRKTKKSHVVEYSDDEIDSWFNQGIKDKNMRDKASGSKGKEKGKGIWNNEAENLRRNQREKIRPNLKATKEETTELSDEEFPKFSKSNHRESRDPVCARKISSPSRFPYFQKRITSDDLVQNCLFRLPRDFSEKHLAKVQMTLILTNEKGNSWEVQYIPSGVSFPRFCGGWASFMHENKLNLGDVCKFELVNKKEMEVYISHS